MAPRRLLEMTAALGLLACALAAFFALRIPVPEQRFFVEGEGLLLGGPRFADAAVEGRGGRIERLELRGGATLAPDPVLLLEEPDVLPSYPAFNRFLERQGLLADSLQAGGLWVWLEGGEPVEVGARRRALDDLPLSFWMQLLFGFVGALLGVGVWAFRRKDISAAMYALTGVCFSIACFSAAVYSTRELALSKGLFRTLSALNHGGTVIFAGALLVLIAHYPRALFRARWLHWVVVPLSALWWILDLLQIFGGAEAFIQLGVMVFFLPCFPLAAWQWIRSRGRPVERAGLRWFFLAIFSGTTLFAALVLVPPLFGSAPFLPQSLMLGVFLLIYAGIALALVRYRLFDIERWWFNAWLWFFGGVLVVLLDLFLIWALRLSGLVAGALSVLLVGWLYFPARQWLWGRLIRRRGQGVEAFLPQLVAQIGAARDLHELYRASRLMMEEVFAPLKVEVLEDPVAEPVIDEDGQRLRVPAVGEENGLALSFPAGGSRLFSREDLHLARTLLLLVEHAAAAIARREEGIDEERQRIMRDLHDDVGGTLLSLLHVGDARTQGLSREALQALRDIVRALDSGPTRLSSLVADLRREIASRAGLQGVEAILDVESSDDPIMSARETSNVVRILRESVTNALRHGGAQRVRVRMRFEAPSLLIEVRDDGPPTEPEAWRAGQGTRSLQARAADLGGEVRWLRDTEAQETVVSVRLCLQAGADASPQVAV